MLRNVALNDTLEASTPKGVCVHNTDEMKEKEGERQREIDTILQLEHKL